MAYDTDFYQWTAETARLLREGRIAEADIEHVAEEIESLGKRDFHELRSRLSQILEHLLKLRLARGNLLDRNTAGWKASIERQRAEIAELLEASPSLRPRVSEALPSVYQRAARIVATEYGVEPPAECPFTEDDVLGEP